jgi:hypothetical protein
MTIIVFASNRWNSCEELKQEYIKNTMHDVILKSKSIQVSVSLESGKSAK